MLAVTFFQLRGLDLQAQLLRSTLDTYTQTLQLTQALLQGRTGHRDRCAGGRGAA